MKTALQFVVVAVVALAIGLPAIAQESWVGKTILVTKQTTIKIGRPGEEGYFAELRGCNFKVLGDKDGWLQVNNDCGSTGWFEKADAVLLDNAVVYCTKRIQENPKDAMALFLRSIARDLSGDSDLAIQDIDGAIRLEPSARHFNVRGIIWFSKKDYVRAIANHTEALRLDPKSDGAYNSRGVAWAAIDERDKAISDFTEVIRLDPKCAAAHFNRALQWIHKNDYDKAVADHTEAIRLDPEFAAIAYYSRGLAWHGKKDYDKAIADYGEAIRLDPKYVHALSTRAGAWALKKDFEKAIADYNEAIRLDPNYCHAHMGLAWTRATCRDPKYRDGNKGLESAKQALRLDPQNPCSMSVLAAAHAESGDFVAAMFWQELAMENPWLNNDAEARRQLELYRVNKPYRQE